MGFDAPFCLPRLGRVRSADLRAAVGDDVFTLKSVVVTVIHDGVGMPTVARVRITTARAGRGEHVRLVCPSCDGAKMALFTDGRGALRCAPCSRRRTRQQREGRMSAWTRLGAREEDRLLRLLLRRRLSASDFARAEILKRFIEESAETAAVTIQAKAEHVLRQTERAE